jgi:hypothetical protein
MKSAARARLLSGSVDFDLAALAAFRSAFSALCCFFISFFIRFRSFFASFEVGSPARYCKISSLETKRTV